MVFISDIYYGVIQISFIIVVVIRTLYKLERLVIYLLLIEYTFSCSNILPEIDTTLLSLFP